MSGNSGCNTYNGGYEASGNALKVGPLVSTHKACATPEGVMEQEQQYWAALQNAATFEIAGDTLTIRDAGGAMHVELSATILLVVKESQAPMSYGIYLYMQSLAGRGPGAALGVLLVLTVAVGTYVSHLLVERANRTLEPQR